MPPRSTLTPQGTWRLLHRQVRNTKGRLTGLQAPLLYFQKSYAVGFRVPLCLPISNCQRSFRCLTFFPKDV